MLMVGHAAGPHLPSRSVHGLEAGSLQQRASRTVLPGDRPMTTRRNRPALVAMLSILASLVTSSSVPAADEAALPAGALVRLGSGRLVHRERVHGVAYSPNGKLLASGGGDGMVRV